MAARLVSVQGEKALEIYHVMHIQLKKKRTNLQRVKQGKLPQLLAMHQ
jgi:hypothetical protein